MIKVNMANRSLRTSRQPLQELGGKVVTFEGVTRGDKDYRPVLTKIKPMKPQAVYFGGMAAEGSLVARQMRDVGIKKAL